MASHGSLPRSAARRLAQGLLVAACLLCAVLAARRFLSGAESAPAPKLPRPVIIVPARTAAMPVTLQATGFVVSEHVVQVRPQVAGMLTHVYFNEGDTVALGQRLFRVEPASFEAELEAARASRDSTRANLQRMQGLVEGHYVTQQDLINARAAATQAEAAWRRATINLSYTVIRAPVAGRTGGLSVRSGNLVAPTDAAPLVTINQMSPVDVQFGVAQQFLPRLREALSRGGIEVSVQREDGAEELDRGTVVFMDNAVSASTGTLALKARLPNAREQLWPGEFVAVRVQLAIESRALVIPQTAVQTGTAGDYVYVIADGLAARREVRVGRQEGDLAVITAGLTEGERVVGRVPTDLRPGAPVRPGPPEAPPRARVTLPGEGK